MSLLSHSGVDRVERWCQVAKVWAASKRAERCRLASKNLFCPTEYINQLDILSQLRILDPVTPQSRLSNADHGLALLTFRLDCDDACLTFDCIFNQNVMKTMFCEQKLECHEERKLQTNLREL
eukprot:m.213739 g.213739  ORF g.213739 m.213739 type:complete len:123 (+) comp17179_c0_seq1:1785-2153(+)